MLSRVSSMVATAGSQASSTASSVRSSSTSRHSRPTVTFSRQNWLYDSFLANTDQYERLATGSPRIGVALLGYALAEPYINRRPDLHSPVHGGDTAAVATVDGMVNGLPGGMVNGYPGGMINGYPGGVVNGYPGGMVNGHPAGAANGYPTHLEFDLPDAAATAGTGARAALVPGFFRVRPKLHTWPLSKKEEANFSVW